MRSIPILLILAATLAAHTAAAQGTPRRPPADTLRFGTTRPAAGDSIAMAVYEEEDEAETDGTTLARSEGESADTVPEKPRAGPYSRAAGTGGPFSVQASGETAARPPRGEVVWLEGGAARPAASDSARGDSARAGTGQRVASGTAARRDTASTTTNRPARRDSASTASRPATRDTAGTRRNGQTAATGNRTESTTPSASTSGRTGSTNAAAARTRSHTVTAGETFYGIARRYGVTAAQLRATNPDVQMDSLEIGDVLRLPASARDSRAGTSSTPAQRPASTATQRTGSQGGSTQRRSHTVAAGETLFGIARRYGVTVAAIREANEMETDQVRTGQRLVIPPAR